MYALSVTFQYGREVDDALGRIRSFRRLLAGMPGIVSVETYTQTDNRFTVVSKWENVDAAQTALGAPGVNLELADRAGIVIEPPEAVELFSV